MTGKTQNFRATRLRHTPPDRFSQEIDGGMGEASPSCQADGPWPYFGNSEARTLSPGLA
jgi:hypothetical protein